MNQNQLTMTRGDTRVFDLSDIVDPDGVAYNLADVTAMSFSVGDLFEKTLTDGIALVESSGGAEGSILVTVAPADTEGAPDVRMAYPYDLQLTLTDGTVNTPRTGLFVIRPDVTE